MSENPYGQPGPGYGDAAPTTPPDARTSVLAVLSFVSGLGGLILCCIPPVGLLGVLFGVPALFSIGASRGQKRGTGLAVTGVVLGLIGAAFGTAVYFGVAQVVAIGADRARQVIAHAEAQDLAQLQPEFASRIRGEVTQERVAAFHAAYHAEVGAYQAVPTSPLGMLRLASEADQAAWDRIGKLGEVYDGAFPIPAEFDRKPGFVVVAIDSNAGRPMPLLNLGVLPNDGSDIIWLLPAPSAQTAPGPDLSPSPAPLVPEGEEGESGGEGSEDPEGEEGGG